MLDTWPLVHTGMCMCFDGPRIARWADIPILFDKGVVVEPKSKGHHGGIPVYVYSGDVGPMFVKKQKEKPNIGSGFEYYTY